MTLTDFESLPRDADVHQVLALYRADPDTCTAPGLVEDDEFGTPGERCRADHLELDHRLVGRPAGVVDVRQHDVRLLDGWFDRRGAPGGRRLLGRPRPLGRDGLLAGRRERRDRCRTQLGSVIRAACNRREQSDGQETDDDLLLHHMLDDGILDLVPDRCPTGSVPSTARPVECRDIPGRSDFPAMVQGTMMLSQASDASATKPQQLTAVTAVIRALVSAHWASAITSGNATSP